MKTLKLLKSYLLSALILLLCPVMFVYLGCTRGEKTQNIDKSSSGNSNTNNTEIYHSSKDKNKKTNSDCDFRSLLKKNDIKKIGDDKFYLDLDNNVVYTPDNRQRKVEINSNCYDGSFTGSNKKELMVLLEINGNFSEAEGGGLNTILIFDKSDILVKKYGLNSGNMNNIEFVGDIDNDGLSEIFCGGWGHGAGMLSTGISIYYGQLDKNIFYRPMFYSGSDYRPFSYDSEYSIKGNEVTFDLKIDFFTKNNYDKPIRSEKHRDVFIVSNGKVKHKEGKIEDLEKYLKQYENDN